MTAAGTVGGGKSRPASGAPLREARRAAALRRRRKVRRAGAAFFGVLGLICGWLVLLHRPPEPRFVAFAVTEYDPIDLPVNPFAQQDDAALSRHFPREDTSNRFALQDRAALVELRSGADPLLVVYLCAHAWSDGSEVYLVPADGRAGDARSGVALSGVLDKLKAGGGRRTLVLLDVMRPLADPARGVLLDGVAAAVRPIVEQRTDKSDKSLVVLTACDPGQESLTSEELRMSVFAYYLDRGLRGFADGYPGGSRDGRVSLGELAKYVGDHVDRWARDNRGVSQTPRLFPDDADFPLLSCGTPAEDPAEGEGKPPPYPARLREAWEQRDRLAAGGGLLLPRHLHALEADLLRAERHWRGGSEEKVNRRLDDARQIAKVIEGARARCPDPSPPLSLALAERRGAFRPDPAARKEADRLIEDLDALKPADNKGADDRLKQFLEALPKDRPAEVTAWAAFGALARDSTPQALTVAAVSRLLGTLLPRDGPQYAEVVFVHRLAALRQARKATWPAGTVFYALEATRQGERAVCAGPPAPESVRDQLGRTAADRRGAEAVLFDPAQNAAGAARTLDGAAQQYQDQEKALAEYAALGAAYEDILALLPDTLPALAERNEPEHWLAAARAVRPAGALLAAGQPPPPARLAELTASARALREQFGARKVEQLVKDAEASADPDHRDPNRSLPREIDLLLLAPCLDAGQREKLWGAARRLARRLQRETAERDRHDDTARQKPQPVGGTSDGRPDEVKRALCRARLFRELLSLADAPAAQEKAPGAAVDGLSHGDPGPAGWQAAARELRQQWEVLAQLPPAPAGDEKLLLAADRWNRILGAFGGEVASPPPENDPSLRLRRRQAAAYWQWLADYYKAEADAVAAGGGPAEFYRAAAKEYGDVARRCGAAVH